MTDRKSPNVSRSDGLLEVRLDLWLNASCLFKTRSQAQQACSGGHVSVNGVTAKAHKLVRVGDRVEFRQGERERIIVLRELRDRPIAKAEAGRLYDDLSPPPSPADPLERILTAPPGRRERGAGRPTKKQRRNISRLRGN